MLHSGSRGLGHQVATDALVDMEAAMVRDGIQVNDRQLACARINSPEGQKYLGAMGAAANYAWVNRSSMTFLTRQAFAKVRKIYGTLTYFSQRVLVLWRKRVHILRNTSRAYA